MEKIFQHIERLLVHHDYVVVPGLGGFVVQKQTAQIYVDRICAPRSVVSFNPLMPHNDGLLAIEISRAEKMSYRKAVECVGDFVDELNDCMQHNDEVCFGRLGQLRKSDDGVVLFTPSGNQHFLPHNIGLKDLYKTQRKDETEVETRHLAIPLPSRNFMRYAAAAVLLIGLLTISPRLNDGMVAEQADLTSFLNLIAPEEPIEEAVWLDDAINDAELEIQPVAEPEIAEPIELYHIVVASLSRDAAERYCQQLVDENFATATIVEGKLWRVAINSFANRDEAVRYMNQLRSSDPRFETAWVLLK